jgi:rhodanese-related sulfurtransferase
MSRTTPDGVTEYQARELEALLEEGRVLLIDVREPMEYAAERISGALLYPLSTFEAAHLPPDAPRMIVFHCAVGGRSLTAARMRKAAGHPAAHLAGGISHWKAEGLPVIRGGPRRA